MTTKTKRLQCKRATNEGVRCLHKSLPGSEFCFKHQPREVWPTLIVGVLLGFLFGCLANYIFYKKSQIDDSVNRHLSLQRYVPPAIKGFPVVIADGTNILTLRKPGSFSSMISCSPFEFRVDKDGIIEIYGEIRYIHDKLSATIHKDQIITSGTGIDINSDSKALEIMGSNGMPIFQFFVVPYEEWKEQQKMNEQNTQRVKSQYIENLDLAPEIKKLLQESKESLQNHRDDMFTDAKEVIVFYYIHHLNDYWWCVTPFGSFKGNNYESMLELQCEIPRLFKYPGHKYPGMRLESQN